jgi:hypothetical protein
MKEIIAPLPKSIIEEELVASGLVRLTRKGGNEIYIVDNKNAPNTLLEIGRLREVTFRASGGGTGEEMDLDEYDTGEICYKQLIVWSPAEKEIVGGYGNEGGIGGYTRTLIDKIEAKIKEKNVLSS